MEKWRNCSSVFIVEDMRNFCAIRGSGRKRAVNKHPFRSLS